MTFNAQTGERQPFPGNRIPDSRIDPVAKRVAELYPAPNISGREHLRDNFFFSPVQTNDFDQYDFRWDYKISNAHQWFVRYSIRNQNEDQAGSRHCSVPFDWRTCAMRHYRDPCVLLQ